MGQPRYCTILTSETFPQMPPFVYPFVHKGQIVGGGQIGEFSQKPGCFCVGRALCILAGPHPFVKLAQIVVHDHQATLGQKRHGPCVIEDVRYGGLATRQFRHIQVGHLWITHRRLQY